MLVRLDLSTAERWTTLIGSFEVLHVPVTSSMLSEAAYAATLPDEDASTVSVEARTNRIVKFLARSVIRDWRGIGSFEADDAPPVTPDTVDAVMDIYPVYRAFNDKIVDARVRIDREKKDLGTLPPGTTATGPGTAPIATDPAQTARDA